MLLSASLPGEGGSIPLYLFDCSLMRSKAHELLSEGVDLRPELTRELSLCGACRGGPQWAEEVDERGRGLAARLGLVVEGHAELVLVRLVVARHLVMWARSLEA